MMGVDQRGEDQGRSDSLMLFTLNPTKIDENYKYST